MAYLSGRPARGALAIALLGSALWVAGAGCIRSTPFQSDPSVTGVTAKNLAKLSKQTPGQRFKFAAFGDTHTDYDNLQVTVNAINARDDIELALIVGDMTNLGLLQEFEWAYEVYDRLDVPWLTVMGNHDALGHGAGIYREMYGPFEYSFEYGGLKFLMFNSNTLELGRSVPNRDWLTAEVENRGNSQGVVLAAHHDLTKPDDYADGDVAEFYEALVQRPGIAGVVHGHNEEFELLEWHGVPVLQCGTYEKLFLHTIVTVEAGQLSFELCEFDHCEPAVPIPDPGLE
jgi:3',5'-cyclic-AMP phosphodiesterase